MPSGGTATCVTRPAGVPAAVHAPHRRATGCGGSGRGRTAGPGAARTLRTTSSDAVHRLGDPRRRRRSAPHPAPCAVRPHPVDTVRRAAAACRHVWEACKHGRGECEGGAARPSRPVSSIPPRCARGTAAHQSFRPVLGTTARAGDGPGCRARPPPGLGVHSSCAPLMRGVTSRARVPGGRSPNPADGRSCTLTAQVRTPTRRQGGAPPVARANRTARPSGRADRRGEHRPWPSSP